MDLSRVELASPAFKADPHPVYARMRDEAPVAAVALPDGQRAWMVTRYDDVLEMLGDRRLVKDRRRALTPEELGKQPWMPRSFEPLTRNMLDLDPPDHTRLRTLVHKAFTPRLVERLRGRIEEVVEELLEAAARRRRTDLIRDFALPLPTTIIAEMLGVPAGDRHRFHRWSSAIVAANASKWGLALALPRMLAFLRYLRRLVAARREEPREDLVSALVAVEEAGDRLSSDELLAMIFLLLVAGHETTVHLIGNGTLALLDHPEQHARLLADAGLITSAVEEMLRFDGPLETTTERFASEEISIRGVAVPRGALVYGVLASANRDERQFPRADTFDITRDPNRHLAFGHGIHYCLGAPLARLEARIALGALVARARRLRLTVPRSRLRRRRGLVLRGLEALPVTWDG